ncbi:hypothetical protein QQX98_006341 [Neonectria punicea]|uniref:Uncharacterized protein n=1 Tax=Neonectria punicea TaxID=979145 RepID=A0ABR1H2I3_9HYPO
MYSSGVLSLALGLLRVDLAAASLCKPSLESSSIESASTTTSEATLSSTAASTTESTSTAPEAIPTFNLVANGGSADGETVDGNPNLYAARAVLGSDSPGLTAIPLFLEEGTGRLKTTYTNNYLCVLWAGNADPVPAEVMFCNDISFGIAPEHRLQYITCEAKDDHGISCTAPAGHCIQVAAPRDRFETRCSFDTGLSFEQFYVKYELFDVGSYSYHLYMGLEEGGYEEYNDFELAGLKTRLVEVTGQT